MQTFSVCDECEYKYITGNNSALGELPYCSDFLVLCSYMYNELNIVFTVHLFN
jgi:hypothetical protein